MRLRLTEREISSIQSASLHCPNIYNALSLSVVLCHSHSLHWNPRCHEKNKNGGGGREKKDPTENKTVSSRAMILWWQKHIEEHISQLNLKLLSMYTESHILVY